MADDDRTIYSRDFITVRNPNTVRSERLPVERIPVGLPGDYKPCVTVLPDGGLILTAFHQARLDEGKIREEILFFRSRDGGRSWPDREVSALLGREPYFSSTRDGTLFVTVHLLSQDVRNPTGYVHSYLHRSTDAGKTWETLPILCEDVPGTPEKTWTHTSRNVLEMQDGTLVLGVSSPEGRDYLWRSADGGKTWDRSVHCTFDGVDVAKLWCPFWAETLLWQARNGDLLGIFRVDPRVFPLAAADNPSKDQEYWDHFERMIVFRSRDGGENWTREPELGSFYGEMYPAILRLGDGRLLMTFTVRDLRPPLGVQAVLGVETPNGFAFDFATDRLIIDANTPLDKQSGGGFGPTVRMPDETLVTAYSYGGADDLMRVEVARWRLP